MDAARYQVVVGGQHKALVTVELGKAGDFSGSISSPEFGTGAIISGTQSGNNLMGQVSLDGHHADFAAAVDGDKITGKLSYGWFFSMKFTGTRAA